MSQVDRICQREGCGHNEIAHTHFDDEQNDSCKWCTCLFFIYKKASEKENK